MKPLAPSPDLARSWRWPTWARLLGVVAVAGVSACVIGPKQDDPASLVDTRVPPDSAAPPADTSPGELVDASTGTPSDAANADEASGNDAPAVPGDTGCARGDAADAGETGCGDDGGDGGGDAVTDG